MNGRQLREALRGGRRVYGTSIVASSPLWVGPVRRAGLDFVFLDSEHVPRDRDTLSWMCQAYAAADVAPIVRIPSPDPYQACQVLDGGAMGVIAPYIETAEEVRRLVGAVKLRPLKGERLAGALEGSAPLEPELVEYLNGWNVNNVLIVNIESVPAMRNLDEILAVPGLDAVLIGPHDLTCNLGIPEQYDSPKFLDAVREILSRARKKGIGAGVHFWIGIEREIEWYKAGGNLVVHSSDITFFGNALKSEIAQLRASLGDAGPASLGDAGPEARGGADTVI